MMNQGRCAVPMAVLLLLAGCGSNSTDVALASITVTTTLAAPAIATQPAAQSVTAGQAATLTVSATGGGTLAYQWRRDGIPIAGATAATFAITATAVTGAGSYDVVVTNSAGSVMSAKAFLSVDSASGAPAIVAQPASQAVAPGAGVTLTVSASGSGTMAYQWRHNGAAIAGATAVSYTLAAARAFDAGSYDVVVTNANGVATSAAATLEVTAAGSTSPHSLATFTAALAFYNTLAPDQQSSLQLTWSLDTARRWSSLPDAMVARNGLALGGLNAAQQAAAVALIKTALGDTGSSLQLGVQAAGDYLAANGGGNPDGSGNVHVAFLGTPSATGFWMLQLSGHHATWNLAFNGRGDSPTPAFFRIEPKAAFTVDGVAYDPLLVQRSAIAGLGAALLRYPAAQLAGSVPGLLFGADGAGNTDGTCPRAVDTVTTHGVLYSRLAASDQALAQTAIRAWVDTQAIERANTLLGAYLNSQALAQTSVAYAGTGSVDVPGNYLLIEGPRLWLEWSVQRSAVNGSDVQYQATWRDKFADYGGKCG